MSNARGGEVIKGTLEMIVLEILQHEPMHGWFVGRGMLDAACPGAVFTSPVPDQILVLDAALLRIHENSVAIDRQIPHHRLLRAPIGIDRRQHAEPHFVQKIECLFAQLHRVAFSPAYLA